MSSPRAKARHGGPVIGSNPRLIDIFAILRPAQGAEPPDFIRSATAAELAWQDRGLCAQTDPEAFFPEKGGSTREAKRVCRACDVRSECLEFALENGERFGIWGGLSERERRRIERTAGTPVNDADDDDEPAPQFCKARLHRVTPENTYSDGRCRPCRIAQAAARRAAGGSTSQRGTRAA